MINKVYEILKPLGLPMKWQLTPPFDSKNIVISYHFFNEGNLLYGEGEAVEEGGSLQVDVFSKVDYMSAVKEIKRLLKGACFLYADARDDTEELDSNTIIYHKILIFNYCESEVFKNVE